MLDTGGLFFSRVSLLEDQFEGRVPKEAIRSHPTVREFREYGSEHLLTGAQRYWASWRDFTFVSCWSLADPTTSALWQHHAAGGVAIRSTVGRLVEALRAWPFEVYVGQIEYVDFPGPIIESLPNYFLRKDRRFAFEQEIRAVIRTHPSTTEDRYDVLQDPGPSVKGVTVTVDLAALVDAVHFAPHVDSTDRSRLREELDRRRLQTPLHQRGTEYTTAPRPRQSK